MQEKGRDGGNAAGSEAERLFVDGTCALGLLVYGDVEKVDRGAAGDKIQKALSGLIREVSDRSDTSLIRDLRDVGTGKIKHVFAGTCPEVWEAEIETANDRADPGDKCEACDVLRRADAVLGKVSDRSDTFDARADTGLAAFREKMLASVPDEAARIELDGMLLRFIERAEAVILYVLATLPYPNLVKSAVTTTHPDWVAIHMGRGISSARQLEALLKEISGAGK